MASNTTLCAHNLSSNTINPTIVSPFIEELSVTDVDAQGNTLTAAQVKAGIVVHTSVTGAGNVTSDTAANYIADLNLDNDGDTMKCYYINDGDQTLTLQAGTGVTIADDGQTIGNNESAVLLIRRTSSSAVTIYHIGA